MEALGDRAVLHHQRRLEEAGHPRRGLEVPEVALDRAHEQAPLPRATRAQRRADRAHLRRVAELCPAAVGLDVADRAGIDPPRLKRRPDDLLLRGAVRHGQPTARPVVVHGGAADHGEDLVAVRDGVLQALEHHHATAFTARVAVRRRVERLAATVGRQGPALAHEHRGPGVEDEPRAAGQGHPGLLGVEALAGQVDGHERRRAGGVHDQARAAQPERVGQATRGHAVAVARARVHVDLVVLLGPDHEAHVVVRDDAQEDAGVERSPPIGGLSRALQRLPGDFQQDALLGIQVVRLARGDPEEPGIELVDAVEVAALVDVDLAGRAGAWLIERRLVPAVVRHVPDGVTAALQQRPQRLRRVGAARQAARHADHRDRPLPLPPSAELGAQIPDGAHRLLEERFGLVRVGHATCPPRTALTPPPGSRRPAAPRGR